MNPFTFTENNNQILKGINNAYFIFLSKKLSNKPKKYLLKEGDIFKLGRITLRVKEIYLNNHLNKELNEKGNNIQIGETNILTQRTIISNEENILKLSKKQKKNICRICYGFEDDTNNPLIQPCICSGTMKYIHYECLKHWIGTQSCIKIDSNEYCSIFIIKNIECELCKNKFPEIIKHNGKLFDVLNYKNCYSKYIVLETLIVDSKKNKFLYVINMERNYKKLNIGRGKEAEILLTDVSVSRIHSIISREGNNIFLEDNNSKFGTLILIQNLNLKIIPDLPLNIQIGRTYLNIQIKKNFSIFDCCTCQENINEYFYHYQSQKEIDYHRNYLIKEDNINDKDEDEDEDEKDNLNENIIKLKKENNDSINEEKLDYVDELNEFKKGHQRSALTLEMSGNFKNNTNHNCNDKKTRNNNNISIPFATTEINPI